MKEKRDATGKSDLIEVGRTRLILLLLFKPLQSVWLHFPVISIHKKILIVSPYIMHSHGRN
jgi:hypothetical protein